MSLTPSHILEYLYCPRFTYFEYVLGIPQFEEKDYKVVKGREVHNQKLEHNKDYLRKRIGAVAKLQDQYLTNDYIRGKVDEVLTLSNGNMVPLDYKFAEYKDKVYETYLTQLKCYAWLIQDNFGAEVPKGYLVYVRSSNKLVEVPLGKDAIGDVKRASQEIVRIIQTNFFPKATKYKARCLNCTYRNICVK